MHQKLAILCSEVKKILGEGLSTPHPHRRLWRLDPLLSKILGTPLRRRPQFGRNAQNLMQPRLWTERSVSWKVLENAFFESWKTLEFQLCKSWKVLENRVLMSLWTLLRCGRGCTWLRLQPHSSERVCCPPSAKNLDDVTWLAGGWYQ